MMGFVMNDKEPPWSLRILSFLENTGQSYDDDCLAKELATRRQTINAACRRLADQGELVRLKILCTRCGRIKLHNFLPKWVKKPPSLPREPQEKPRRPQKPSPKWMEERKAALREIEFIYQCSLNELEVQAARHGMDVPVALANQIDFHKKKLAEVRQELKELEQM
jgi:hypothetical protein